jgi:tryptophan synthase alpha subunit
MHAAPAVGTGTTGVARIAAVFAANRTAGRKALAPFVTAGDPDRDTTVAVIEAVAAAGASLCELGVPYSDPIADGPVIRPRTRALSGLASRSRACSTWPGGRRPRRRCRSWRW